MPRHQETKQLEEQINRLSFEASLASLMNDASIDRVMALDKDLRIISWNKRNEDITGINRQDVIGSLFFDTFPDAANYPSLLKAINHALKGRTVFLPADKGCYDGGYYENHFIPLKDAEQQIVGVLNIKHDVAHRVKAENELKALNKALVKKNRELKQRNEELLSFSHVTSHDLKEPLRKIYMFAEMIATDADNALSEKSKTNFKRIQASVQRMGILTDDVLTFHGISTEQVSETDVNLEHVVQVAKDMLTEQIEGSKAVVEYTRLPIIKGYKNLLTQLFYQLFSNAIKFRKSDVTPVIKLSCKYIPGEEIKHPDAVADVTYLYLCFEDNGIGFEEVYKDKIFQMFQRLFKEEYPGTGIGLALCKKIAYLHHGFMTAESELGTGSSFCIYLPATKGNSKG